MENLVKKTKNDILEVKDIIEKSVEDLEHILGKKLKDDFIDIKRLYDNGQIDKVEMLLSSYDKMKIKPVYKSESETFEYITGLYSRYEKQPPAVSVNGTGIALSAELVRALDKFNFDYSTAAIGTKKEHGIVYLDFNSDFVDVEQYKRKGRVVYNNSTMANEIDEMIKAHDKISFRGGTIRYGVFLDYERKRVLFCIKNKHKIKR